MFCLSFYDNLSINLLYGVAIYSIIRSGYLFYYTEWLFILLYGVAIYLTIVLLILFIASLYVFKNYCVCLESEDPYMYTYGVDVVEWSRALDVRLSEWCCSVSMVWVQIPSREEQQIDSSKI